jgi:hypothetical protein
MRRSRGYEPRQLCLICGIVERLAAQAEEALQAGEIEAVGEHLAAIRTQIIGYREGQPSGSGACRGAWRR